MEKDCKERCDLLRSYFHRVNPFSLPCTYKSNFESSAIHGLLLFSVHKNEDTCNGTDVEENSNKKEFGPWKGCRHFESRNSASNFSNKSLDSNTTNSFNNQSYVKGKDYNVTLSRKLTVARPVTSDINPVSKKKSKEFFKNNKNSISEESSSKHCKPSLQYSFQYHDDYHQFMKDYSEQYTANKIQGSNSGRQLASRSRIIAYDLRKTVQDLAGISSVNLIEKSPNQMIVTRRPVEVPIVKVNLPGLMKSSLLSHKRDYDPFRQRKQKAKAGSQNTF